MASKKNAIPTSHIPRMGEQEIAEMLSALPPPEPQGSRERSSLATCSLPASICDGLVKTWQHAARTRDLHANELRAAGAIDEAIPLENSADAYQRCADMLRRHVEDAMKRQPRENADAEPTPTAPARNSEHV